MGAKVTSSLVMVTVALLGVHVAEVQIDPENRELLQFGYNAALQGHPPQSGYAFYYRNKPEFIQTNWTLRLAIAPTYLDSELGMSGILGPDTHLGIGLAGGGYADSYPEIRLGTFLPRESFVGYGGEFSTSIYHLFNPGSQIPLNGILRGAFHYSTYQEDSETDRNFKVPDNRETFSVKTGLRWGGREPTLYPSLAMELSVWYDGQFRAGGTGLYGYDDREVEAWTHVFWGEALLAYTFPKSNQRFEVSLTLGTAINPDRFSAFRLGALLPLVSEYPLSIPGYYYQEISARNFALISANYLVPLDKEFHWNINVNGAAAAVDYLAGLEQPGNWNSGVGAGVLYRRSSWRVMTGYAYGFNAIRSSGRGAHSIGILLQLDWSRAKQDIFTPTTPDMWRGVQRMFGIFGQ